jgi:23S rRNA (uracil1939-C5)-methyltransferase
MPPSERSLVRIERMTPEGQGLGRSQDGPGRVVFVPYTAPGDHAEISLEKEKPGFAQGRLLRVVSPGPKRIEPRCPLHFKIGNPLPCGGCDWQHIDYEEQKRSKRELVLDCLTRIGKLRDVPVHETLSSPQTWRYRNKVQVPFGMVDGKVVAGFYAPGSHRIVDFSDCLVQPEFSVAIVLKVKALAQELGWPIYEEDKGRGWLRHLYVRTNQNGSALVALVTRSTDFPKREKFLAELQAAFPQVVSVFQNVQPMKTSVVLGPIWKHVWGRHFMEEKILGLTFRCSPGAFLQVNTPACEVLYGAARDFLGKGGFLPELALDLYCGVGTITLSVAGKARRVLGVEENKEAVQDAWENSRRNDIRNARFMGGTVESLLGKLRKELGRFPRGSVAALLDPPRSGCAEPVLKSLRDPAFQRVVYVSCNPATFARDAAWLVSYGYRLKEVQPVDLFPQTSHIETVSWFDREAVPPVQRRFSGRQRA